MESGAARGALDLRELRTYVRTYPVISTLVMQVVGSEKFCSALIGACDCVGLCVWTEHVANALTH